MKKLALSCLLSFCLCGWAQASGTSVSTQVALTSTAIRLQAMRQSDVARLRIVRPEDVAAAGLQGLQPGDEIEVQGLPGDRLRVRHLPTGQTGEMPRPAP